jgi:signal transduction histidine kinase
VIERQVQNMSRLLDDLLDVSRITRGTMEIRKELVELQAVVDAAIEIARPAIEVRKHAQVIANLLTNAAKYTNPQDKSESPGSATAPS